MINSKVRLTPSERRELQRRLRSRTIAVAEARRAQIILLLAQGHSFRAIGRKLSCTDRSINTWKQRFLRERLSGLASRYRGRKAHPKSAQIQARILAATRQTPRDGTTHWSTRRLARQLGTSHSAVARTWRAAALQPHAMRRYMASNDPRFQAKAADIIGLYLQPPAHAAVFCVDEKSAIQALDRRDPVLPLSPGRAERHGFEYYRHGTLSLYAALETGSGQIIGQTASRHTSAEFVAFLAQVVDTQPAAKPIHIIADNLSAHKTKLVEAFLSHHPNVTLHFTPTYSSWLNQVEIWFSKLERQVIARGVFRSVNDLRKKLMSYIRHYNKVATPIRWTYKNPRRRISSTIRSSDTWN
jgi:transposase